MTDKKGRGSRWPVRKRGEEGLNYLSNVDGSVERLTDREGRERVFY